MANLGIDYAATDVIKTPGIAGFTEAKRAGARIIIPRAIFGGMDKPSRDPYWGRDKEAIVAAGLNRSAYMFLTTPTSYDHVVPSPEEQVKAFIAYVGTDLWAPKLGVRHQSMVPCIDIEQDSDMTGPQYFDWVLRAARAMRAYYGAWPMLYTSDRVWTEELKDHAAGELVHCPLWIAKPWPQPTGAPVNLSGVPNWAPKTIPQFGDTTNWLLYQYQGDGLGMPGMGPEYVDVNRVNVIKRGAKGTLVGWLQARLGNLVVDQNFGPATEARLKEVQGCYGLTADGVFGSDSATLVSWLNPAPLTVKT